MFTTKNQFQAGRILTSEPGKWHLQSEGKCYPKQDGGAASRIIAYAKKYQKQEIC